jgi:hypothetical protein
MSGAFKLRAQRRVIENFAVIDQKQVARFLGHRLLTRGQVDNAQPAVSQKRVRVSVEALRVGAAMANAIGHPREDLLRSFSRLHCHKSRDPTHTGASIVALQQEPMARLPTLFHIAPAGGNRRHLS